MYLNWIDRERQHESAYLKLDAFFENLYEEGIKNTTGATIAYRESQQRFASTVMEAIKDRKILLIQAGVGTGKSFGYLIPIFYTLNNVTTFDKVVISTSTIALQEQLLEDVNFVSELLGINIKAWLAKGINNYACLKKINETIKAAAKKEDFETVEMLNELRKTMLKNHECDKNRLPMTSQHLWQNIKVCGGCYACNYKEKCPFIEHQNHIRNMPIIITNHTQLSNMIRNDSLEFTGSSLLVVDEAHKLEEQIRLANQEVLNFQEVIHRLDAIYYGLMEYDDYDYTYEFSVFSQLHRKIKPLLFDLAKTLRNNGRMIYSKQNICMQTKMEDFDKININLKNRQIRLLLETLLEITSTIIKLLNNISDNIKFESNYKFLKKLAILFADMLKCDYSERLYWIRFISQDKIVLVHTIKSADTYMAKLFNRDIPAVFTSGTMTTNGNYDNFIDSINPNRDRVVTEDPISSPFDFANNSLFYYDKEAVSPTEENRDEYYLDIATRIRDLIKITEGKSLILFTSKSDMRAIYNIVSKMGLQEKLIIQTDDDVNNCKSEFEKETNSCLFATGVFWEGIDIPGNTLSNLIIVKLPFPVQDPLVEYKKNRLPMSEAWKVDLDEMLMKMAQGTGRLIRTKKDIGIVCCLDSRTPKYLDYLMKSLPFKNFTSDLEDVVKFSKEKILGIESIRQDIKHQLEMSSQV